MSLFIASLNSGSNGNCYYIGSEDEAILVDAGISCRETEKRMKRLALSMAKVKAVFISHEHADHINGVSVLSKKYRLPVYITERTQEAGKLLLEQELTVRFIAYEPVSIGRLFITAFPKQHDAEDPHSFVVSSAAVKVGIFTDIGISCEPLEREFKQCHAAFLEANYDMDMLTKGSYPFHLKQRIMGGKGHLSNMQALELVRKHKPAFMSHLLLAHLSNNNNDPELVQELFSRHAGNTRIIVASRHEETRLYHITPQKDALQELPKKSGKTQLQLRLF